MDRRASNVVATYQNDKYSEPIRYVFELFFSVLGIKCQVMSYSEVSGLQNPDLVVSYGHDKPYFNAKYHIHIYESDLFGSTYLHPESMPDRPLKRFNDLPIIYEGNNRVERHVRREGTEIETDIDIIASSFFMLTRYEEVIAPVQDKFERYPATASLAYKEGFLDRPIVNEYIEVLWRWIDSFNLGLSRKDPWGGKKFAVCLTHDVDRVKKFRLIPPFLTLKRALFQMRSLGKASAIFADYVSGLLRLKDDPYQVALERIIDLEKEHGVKSSFYFMAHGEDYSIRDPFIAGLIEHLKSEHFEIGLHGSFNSYDNPDILRQEKGRVQEVVGNPIVGSRQHYLRWKTPDTWRALERVGLKYDTTSCFVDHEGFRSGICYPYRPFDILENRILDIWEVPLIVMEGSLFDYQDLSPKEGLERIQALVDTVERYNGVFAVLWHNSSFYEPESVGMFETYEQMLDYISNKNALCNTVEGVLANWIKMGNR